MNLAFQRLGTRRDSHKRSRLHTAYSFAKMTTASAATLLLLGGCAANRSAIATAAIATYNAARIIQVPSSAPNPTASDTPAPLPTITPTMEPTATNTVTSTVPPSTATKAAWVAGKTQKAAQAAQTNSAKAIRSVQTAAARNATHTAVATYAASMYMYKAIEVSQLMLHSTAHMGQKVKILGEVFNVVSTTEIQVHPYGVPGYSLYVTFEKPMRGLFNHTNLKIFGVVGPSTCFTNSWGDRVCTPSLTGAWLQP